MAAVAIFAVAVLGVFAPAAVAAVNATGPTATITSGPTNGAQLKPGAVSFKFAAPSGSKFQCQLDTGSWKTCKSPYSLPVIGLKVHTFQVRAVDSAGNQGPAASVSWSTVLWASTKAYTPGTLLARAQANPYTTYKVIVQTKNIGLQRLLATFSQTNGRLGHKFVSIPAINANLPGWAVVQLAENKSLFGDTVVTADVPVRASDYDPAGLWQASIEANRIWDQDAVTCETDPNTGFQIDPSCTPKPVFTFPSAPAIAVVDSGVDNSALPGRVIANQAMSSLSPGTTNDAYGHGTFVASLAAGSSSAYPGVAPKANIVSLKVMNDQGEATTSDVIAAADWILQNKDQYGIKVANFSLHASSPSSFKFDPLDKAVERLWFSGVTVVVAAGNFGDGTAKPMAFAPGNDPFVITVGATDINGTSDQSDDTIAPFSAFGHTLDGFAKPEIVAPGRYMVASVPAGSTLTVEKAQNLIAPDLIRLSGTSFSAPVVAGAAAQVLAVHPDWTPDQVKGALMISAKALTILPITLSQGAGELDVARATALASAPNPNLALDQFLVPDPTNAGGMMFDDVSWSDAAQSDVSWSDVSWSDVSWSDVSWSDVSWSDVSWSDVSWSDVSWSDVSWSDVSWSDVSWSDVSWSDVSWSSVSWSDVAQADAALANVSWSDVSWSDNAAGE